jgi:hypothetical protein
MNYIVGSFIFSLIIGLVFILLINKNDNDDDNTGSISF